MSDAKMKKWIAEHRNCAKVKKWLKANPPPASWRGTPMVWAYTEMAFAPR